MYEGSDNCFRLLGPVKTLTVLEHRYLKNVASLYSDLINCFRSPNLMWRGGNKTFSDGAKVILMTLQEKSDVMDFFFKYFYQF